MGRGKHPTVFQAQESMRTFDLPTSSLRPLLNSNASCHLRCLPQAAIAAPTTWTGRRPRAKACSIMPTWQLVTNNKIRPNAQITSGQTTHPTNWNVALLPMKSWIEEFTFHWSSKEVFASQATLQVFKAPAVFEETVLAAMCVISARSDDRTMRCN